jgi:hypothetical protein
MTHQFFKISLVGREETEKKTLWIIFNCILLNWIIPMSTGEINCWSQWNNRQWRLHKPHHRRRRRKIISWRGRISIRPIEIWISLWKISRSRSLLASHTSLHLVMVKTWAVINQVYSTLLPLCNNYTSPLISFKTLLKSMNFWVNFWVILLCQLHIQTKYMWLKV